MENEKIKNNFNVYFNISTEQAQKYCLNFLKNFNLERLNQIKLGHAKNDLFSLCKKKKLAFDKTKKRVCFDVSLQCNEKLISFPHQLKISRKPIYLNQNDNFDIDEIRKNSPENMIIGDLKQSKDCSVKWYRVYQNILLQDFNEIYVFLFASGIFEFLKATNQLKEFKNTPIDFGIFFNNFLLDFKNRKQENEMIKFK